jgi:hypothetical protein
MTPPASRNPQRGEQQQQQRKDQSLLWSCIARNDIILTEAGEDRYQGAVTRAAVQLLAKKSTPGWEYSTCSAGTRNRKLKGVKFHIYDHKEDAYSSMDNPMIQRTIWVYACVYDPTLVELQEVQVFIEKMVVISEHYRDDSTSDWRYGQKGVAQASFGPILQQRMQEVTYLGKMAMLQTQMDHATSIMARNILGAWRSFGSSTRRIDDLEGNGGRIQNQIEKATTTNLMAQCQTWIGIRYSNYCGSGNCSRSTPVGNTVEKNEKKMMMMTTRGKG